MVKLIIVILPSKTYYYMSTLLLLIIAFVLLEFAVSSVLSWLNGKWLTHPIPKVLEGLYDEEKYRKQQEYTRANRRLGWIERCVMLVITLVILLTGVFGWLDNLTARWSHGLLTQLLMLDMQGNILNAARAKMARLVIMEETSSPLSRRRPSITRTVHRKHTMSPLMRSTGLCKRSGFTRSPMEMSLAR